jgi:RimJ/RimL family protein N-acetyltransferase
MKNYILDQRNIFLKGEKIYLVSLSNNEINNTNWYGWFNDEEVCQTLQKHYFPNSSALQTIFLESSINDKTLLLLGIYSVEKENLIGVTSFHGIDLINSKAGYSIVIGEKDSRNLLNFIEVSKLMFKHGFYSLNLNRIYGGSISKKLVDLQCRSLGCKEEGIARSDIYKNGKFHDSYNYGLLRSDFENFNL